jgi:hypothetical protein
MLDAEGFIVATLPEPPTADGGIADVDYVGWLGVSQAQDARDRSGACWCSSVGAIRTISRDAPWRHSRTQPWRISRWTW